MNKILFVCVLTIVHSVWSMVYGQNIPIGTWRLHISYTDIVSVSISPSKIYGAAANGIMALNLADNSISTITKMDGLSSTNITQIAFDEPRNQLLVTYADGDIDIIREREIVNINTLKISTLISGSKRINHISILQNLAYLSTDFGIVVVDLAAHAIKETWRDIGPVGAALQINQSTFYSDSIFLATENGVLAGKLTDNLLDYNNWKRFSAGIFNGNIQAITHFNGSVHAAINGSGIYAYENNAWQRQPYLQALQYKNITANQTLLVTAGTMLYQVTPPGAGTTITSEKIENPAIAYEDAAGKLWIGDAQNGLVSNRSGSFESFAANGPTFTQGFRLQYNNRTMYALSGGFSSTLAPLRKQEYVNFFADGIWNVRTDLLDKDITNLQANNKIFVSSSGYGLQTVQESATILWDETNSPLQNVAAGRNVRVTDIAVSDAGLWAANAGASQPLHLLKNDNTWESFSLTAAARYTVKIQVDLTGNVWMVINPSNGGGIVVFNRRSGQSVYLSDTANAGGLPSRFVYSIAIDRDGFVWVGTDAGVAYFPNPAGVFNATVNAAKPVFENRFLLRDERVTAIEVDGGNRKWMGTENGLWLFNEFGESQVYNFNAQNSPMLSNNVADLEINDQSGEIFILTDAGIASFRSDATPGEISFDQVKIFPNPVTNQFNGQVSISGLVTDAIVKITDVSGKLVWQSQANGGSAAWNVRDYNGRRVATGMYLVFCIAQDGTESMVGKIAVVN